MDKRHRALTPEQEQEVLASLESSRTLAKRLPVSGASIRRLRRDGGYRYRTEMRPRRHFMERFWEKVNHTETCWLWTASVSHGYGYIGTGSRSDGTRTNKRAHVVAYELLVGPVPKGHDLHHLCGNRNCVRPDHLEVLPRKQHVMRHDGPTGKNARKTKCPKGHPLSGDNLITEKNGARRCRTCRQIWRKPWVEKTGKTT